MRLVLPGSLFIFLSGVSRRLDAFWYGSSFIPIEIAHVSVVVVCNIIVLSILDGFQAVQKGEFLGVLLLSYAIFSNVMSEIIPLYTLCTSMGQLVNKEM
jgi:hypothetical protein